LSFSVCPREGTGLQEAVSGCILFRQSCFFHISARKLKSLYTESSRFVHCFNAILRRGALDWPHASVVLSRRLKPPDAQLDSATAVFFIRLHIRLCVNASPEVIEKVHVRQRHPFARGCSRLFLDATTEAPAFCGQFNLVVFARVLRVVIHIPRQSFEHIATHNAFLYMNLLIFSGERYSVFFKSFRPD
jgi:hypothetical protein